MAGHSSTGKDTNPTTDWDDERIITALQHGGAQERGAAMAQLFYNRGWPGRVRAFVLKQGGTVEDAEDHLQDVLVATDRALRQGYFKGEGRLDTYIHRIMQQSWYNKKRKKKPILTGHAERAEPTDDLDIEQLLLSKEKVAQLMELMGQVGDRCKLIYYFRSLGDSFAEIADKMGFSSAALAKKERYRCTKRLEAFLEANPAWKKLLQ